MASKSFMVLGDPISHSLSPIIHRAAYKVLGFDWTYDAEQVAKGDLEGFLSTSEADGFSVTMPLKYEAAATSDHHHKLVQLTGVANTLVRQGESFSAYNTDVFGITQALSQVLKQNIEVVSLIGAGATAKSSLLAIATAKPTVLFDIYIRDESRAADLLELAGELDVFTIVHELEEFSNFQHLTVNTLPSEGTALLPALEQAGYLLNVSYSGVTSAFEKSFAESRVISGKEMLVWQALQQIRIFSGLKPDEHLTNEGAVIEAMFAAL